MSTREPPSKKTALQESASDLWDAQHELVSFAFLLQHVGSGAGPDSCEDLYGLGISLKRIASTVARSAERIDRMDAS